jgi:acetate kinase
VLVLVLNCGGSSVKYKLFDLPGETVAAEGSVQDIGKPVGVVVHRTAWGAVARDAAPAPDHLTGLKLILDYLGALRDPGGRDYSGIGLAVHKVAHGGDRIGPVEVVDERVKAAIEEMSVIVSVHNPPMLKAINVLEELAPDLPQLVVFETGFHQTIPPYARVYGIPHELAERHGLRKYGFHGASHRYISERAPKMLGRDPSAFKLISVHLGSGTSVAALKDGRSLDVSSGFTPQSGTLMSTRAGDFDPEVLYFLLKKELVSLSELREMLNQRCGLTGISGIKGGDIREVEEAAGRGDPRAALAWDAFCYSIRKFIGAYLAVLEGADAVAFTGGIGEHDPLVRERVCQGLEGLGLRLSWERNRSAKGAEVVSEDDSPVAIVVLPTDEEVMVARQALEHWLARGNTPEA